MKIKLSAVIFLFVALTLSCCQTAEVSTEADVTAIQTLAASWKTAVESGDIDGYMALYADDIVQMPPNAPAVKGKQALEEKCLGLFGMFTVEVTWPVAGTEEIIVADGWAFHLSEFVEWLTPKAGGDKIEMRGKIIEVCQKQPDGSWKFAREIWNLNGPTGKE